MKDTFKTMLGTFQVSISPPGHQGLEYRADVQFRLILFSSSTSARLPAPERALSHISRNECETPEHPEA